MMTESLEAWVYWAASLSGAGALLFALGIRARLIRARLDTRMAAFVEPAVFGAGRRKEGSLRSRVLLPLMTPLAPIVTWLAGLGHGFLPDRQIERIRTNLNMAGLPNSRHLAQFLAAKVGFAFIASLLMGLYQMQGGAPTAKVSLLVAVAGATGFYLPGIWLGRRIARRQQQVLKALPDALDLLSISVSAGLGFDGAMLEVVNRWQNPLTEEFSAVLRDLKLGTSRRDALRDFARRTGVEDVANFTAAVIQADELGTPLKDVLQIQSQQMRMYRRHRAEEQARKATIKMLVPMVFFIFPALFVVLLGPAVPSLAAVTQTVRRSQ
jgi:tight adherence protein C